MKKIVLIIALIGSFLLVAYAGIKKVNVFQPAQNEITDTWYWESENGKHTLELYLTQDGNTITGKHCCVYNDGKRIDCVDQESENSISLTSTNSNIFQGTLRSSFSDSNIDIRITHNTNNNTLFFEVVNPPSAEYYLPDSATLFNHNE